MRFKDKSVVFIGFVFIVFASLLTGLAGCGQTQQTTASGGPDGMSSAPLNEEKSALTSVQMVDAKNRGDLAFTQKGLLYLLYGETGEQKQLTNSGKAYYPVWSFDGQWIAFIFSSGQDENNGQLWLIRRDGQQAHQVQGLPELPNVPNISWSPTANVLVAEGRDGIWVVPVEGKPYQIPGIGKYSGYACWSPDGKALACNSGPTLTRDSNNPQDRQDILYTYNLENGRTTQQLKAPADTGIIVAAWWPDGTGLLYSLDPSYSASLAADGLELQSLKLGDSQPKALTYGLVYRNWLSFLPQGQLLMVAGGNRPVWFEKSLAICDPATGNIRNLTNPKGVVAIDPAPSPDGSKIAFIAAQNLGNDTWGFSDSDKLSDWIATRTLWIENLDGSGAHPLKAAGTGIYQPEWSKDGTQIMYVQDNSLWMIGADDNNPRKILGPFPEWEKDPFGFYGYIWHNDFAWFQP
ncbi:MAG: biopolymer transporter Tol [Desulfosporosinus sp.]|nr:biopolymer transporter Tol [Desulfosporosinus sp.]